MKNIRKILLGLVAVMLLAACVTHKKKEDEIGWFKKGYHNLTSRYNYWFNADELLHLTEQKLSDLHKDNYNQILDLYPYAATDPQSSKADLESVITKSSKGIGLHRPSDWVDDCYTLIGEAQYIKRDYETAENTFKYIRDEYDPKKKTKSYLKHNKKKTSVKKKAPAKKKKKKPAPKKKKKKKSTKKKADDKSKTPEEKSTVPPKEEAKKPEEQKDDTELIVKGANPYKKPLQRTSAFPYAMIWYGKTLVEREKYDEAEFMFRGLHEDVYFPPELKGELYKAEAYMWIKQKKYDKALEPLEKAIDLTRKRKDRARMAFILAQLYDRSGKYEGSFAAYDRVLHNAPTYEMEFNARLRQVQAGWANGKVTSADANKNLERLAKDQKNFDYRDQIYFVMADIALKDGLKKDAIALLRKSLNYNKNNAPQRAESFLKLADLYFEGENFVQAKLYYDSTLTVLPNTDERYKRANTYAANLKDIARLIQTIAANDSIVRIFHMNESERKEFAQKLKKQREEEAKAAVEKAKAQALAAANASSSGAPPPQAGNKASTFYFYNDAFLKKGKKDFTKVWGDRKLEDNWRRNSRPLANLGAGGADENGAPVDSTAKDGVSQAEINDLFKGIPKSEAELTVLHLATYEAMYQLGTLFRDKLQNNKRSTGTLEELQSRYPDTLKYQKETWYYCYLGFTDLSNPTRAKFYSDKLCAKYQNSSYCKAISDAGFLSATKAKQHELNKFYEDTYGQFKKGDYKGALERCTEAPKTYGSQNPLMAKFALLSALCIGNLQGNEAYCKALSEVIARYPESAESTRAKEIARVIQCKGFEVDDSKKKPAEKVDIDDAFTREDDKLHYFLIVLNAEPKLEDVKAAVSDYNRENHKLEQLRISNIFLGTDVNTPIIVIRKFDNKEQAMRYYNEVKDKKDFLGEPAKKGYTKEFFAVTQENYRRVLKNKTLDGYREFFNDNYLKK